MAKKRFLVEVPRLCTSVREVLAESVGQARQLATDDSASFELKFRKGDFVDSYRGDWAVSEAPPLVKGEGG